MQIEVITRRDDLLVRRLILGPGEATPWHIDVCRRFTVVVCGEQLSIEFRDGHPPLTVAVHAGMAEWDEPDTVVHRAVNIGTIPYEEVVTFFLDVPGVDPQPEHS
jgi:hypothetical protein